MNAFTIDVEDYFQVSAFEHDVSRAKWDEMESRVEKNTIKILEILNQLNIKGTFFVLGWIAERYPELVKMIDTEGHEIASHGYSHKLIYNQNISEFKEETIKSKDILEAIIQKPIYGYRAASYSITNKSLWALDILEEAGFKYDSSIFPVRHDRYGIHNAKKTPHNISTSSGNQFIEYPLSTYGILNYRLPISGGGYFRLFPYFFTKFALNSINKAKKPFVFYLHPWEVDPDQPRIPTNFISKFRHYNNLDVCEARLKMLLKDFQFNRMDKILIDMGLLHTNVV